MVTALSASDHAHQHFLHAAPGTGGAQAHDTVNNATERGDVAGRADGADLAAGLLRRRTCQRNVRNCYRSPRHLTRMAAHLRAPMHEVHGVVEMVVLILGDLADRDDVWMLQLVGDLSLVH